MMKIVFVFLVLAIVGLAGYSWITLHWSYATGERAGFVQKLSKKGWLCKTWEGEMAMVTMPGTVSEKFYFTVPDEAIAAKINASLGKRVALHYEQHKWIPNSCFGETEYFVTGMQATGVINPVRPPCPGGRRSSSPVRCAARCCIGA